MKRLTLLVLCIMAISPPLLADGPKDNTAENVRPVPRLGIEVTAADRKQLEGGLESLKVALTELRKNQQPRMQQLVPDVEIFHRAVSDALNFQEFFAKGDIGAAKRLLIVGQHRAKLLLEGSAPWTTQTGLVVRGYVSRIDGSVQPYGLVIPDSYTPTGTDRFRLDLWFHGRGETLSEVKFLDQRMKQVGQFAPKDAFVLHPYGRYSNAFKFAGEVDVLEALDSARGQYRIDDDRIAARGFSMGGAACWQFAVHYSDRWFAANPGAGFSETPEFLKFFQKETLTPTWYERKLWHLYDCTDNAVNLFHCPTVAYSGELDIQKQAADIMETALEKEGIDLTHIIGPKTKHAIHRDSKVIIANRLASLAEVGRERSPRDIHFVTYTLKYNRMHWVTVDSLGEHWKLARVDASLHKPNRIGIRTENVTQLTLSMPSGHCPLDITKSVKLTIDEQTLTAPRPQSDRSWNCVVRRDGDRWAVRKESGDAQSPTASGLLKQHNLQGPIDDAFMDSFLIVKPTGHSQQPVVAKWVDAEFKHAVEHWRRHFRGHARVKADTDISDADIASSNLILFGDPASNAVLKKISGKLPIQWNADDIVVGDRRFDAKHHAPVMIYPNPLNPKRYVVLNSGFTYREYDYLNNARQVPKLPDWAIVDLRTPPNSRYPGKIVDADFFSETWQLRPRHQE